MRMIEYLLFSTWFAALPKLRKMILFVPCMEQENQSDLDNRNQKDGIFL
jgi:hypothetical protein